MKIQKRLLLNTIISLATVILILLSLVWSFREIILTNRDRELVDEIRKVVFERILLRDEYLLYPEERAKAQWFAKSESLRRHLALADTHLANEEDKELLQDARKHFDATYSGMSAIMNGNSRKGKAAMNNPGFSEVETRLISQVFLNAYSLSDNINRLHESVQRKATRAQNRGAFVLVVLFLGGIAAIAINSSIIKRTLAKRITVLRNGVEIIGSGSLDHRIMVEGDDELADLARAGNEMAAKLKESYTSVENLQQEIQSRKLTEKALQESERILSEAQRLAQLGNWIWDVKTGKVEWSNQVYTIFQRDPNTFTPQIDSIMALSPWPEDHERDKELIAKAMESHEKGEYEQRFLRPDGSIGHYYSTFQGKYDNGGDLIVMVGTVLDITERKQAEMEIRRLNAELEQRVIDRTAQLEAANKELEAFAYSVSHDLRAPLRAVDGYTRILVEDYESRLDAEGKRVCSVISQSARDMGKLIDDLLSFSRVGRTSMQPSTIDMATMARSIFFEITTPGARERIDFHIGPLPSIAGDPTLFRQVWTNLLLNAVKFSSKMERAVIDVSAVEQEDKTIYSIRDNGAGFDMQYAGKLFGVFQRLHSSKEFEGTGVGLAIVQRIIMRHGGRVWGEGEIGKGATFNFTI